MPAKTGELVAGKYRIIDEMGRGGMGVVFRAEDTRLKRTVALKFLSPELTGDPEARARFVQEARAASALEHPNICTIHEIDETPDGRIFIAMACYEGWSLRDMLKKGKMDHPEALSIALQAARGLAKAHEMGTVHRDIKPGNIFLTDDGQVKILDFGLAKLVSDIRVTRTGATMGTVAYMSPEQAQGKPVDARTDVWSLGVMLYEMLAGELPFDGENEGSLIHAIIQRPARPLRKADPTIPAEIERVVLKALEKKPADRYQTMAEFLSDLEALAEGFKPLRARGGIFRGRILGIRKPLFYGGLVAVAGGAAFVVLALLIPSPGADVFDSVAILPVINETGDMEKDYFANGLTRELNTELYKVAALTVPPVETIMAYRNSDKTLPKIAQELHVKAVAHVSWLQVGNRHRLIYTLSDPLRNKIIATDRLEMEEEDIIFLQRELARAVVAAVKVAVTTAEQTFLAGGRKVNPKAYDLYLKAYQAYFLSGEWGLQTALKAISYLEQAVNIDPTYAQAYAYMGGYFHDLVVNEMVPREEGFRRAEAAVLRALELDNDLAGAHSSLGWIKASRDWDFRSAEQGMKRAIELEPGNYTEQWSYNVFLSMIGKYNEAIARQERLEGNKPPGFLENLPAFYLSAGRYEEGLEEAEKAAERNPSLNNNLVLVMAYGLNGMYDQALALMEEIRSSGEADRGLQNLSTFGTVLALSGKRQEAFETIEKMEALGAQKKIDPSFGLAAVYAALGDRNKAFELLNVVYEKRLPAAAGLKCLPLFHSLHGDPRFEELLRKIGFPEIPGPKTGE